MEYLIIAVLITLLIWAVRIYNLLIRDRHRVDAGWSDIDVQLKRRHDLIGKLVEAVKQYAGFERSTLTLITELRQQGKETADIEKRSALEALLGTSTQKLIVLAEAYPELKANESFLDLQQQISNVENDIQRARRYYNGTVRNLNTRIDHFPDLLLARPLGYRYRAYFEYDPS